MNSSDRHQQWVSTTLVPALIVLVLGGLLGFLLAGDRIGFPEEGGLSAYLLGLAWALILVQAAGAVRMALQLKSDPLPVSVDLTDRATARGHEVKGAGPLSQRIRNLLAAWAEGLAPAQMMGLAQFQSQQVRQAAGTTLAAGLILLVGAAWQGDHGSGVLAALGALALVHLGRYSADRQADQYLESRLLSRLPGHLPNTAMTTKELMVCLSEAVNGTFEKYLPKPEQIAHAVQQPVEALTRETSAQMQNIGRALTVSYEKIAEALNQHAGALGESGSSMGRELNGVLQQHVVQLNQSSEAIAQQLERITQMQANVEQVLRVQEAVDGTLRDVSTAHEFKETLITLRRHLDESDSLLREIAKPRTIRLVEADQEA